MYQGIETFLHAGQWMMEQKILPVQIANCHDLRFEMLVSTMITVEEEAIYIKNQIGHKKKGVDHCFKLLKTFE